MTRPRDQWWGIIWYHTISRCEHNTNTQQTTQKNQKYWHHDLPPYQLPAAPIYEVSAIAVCFMIDPDLRNTPMQFLCEINFSFILFIIILWVADRHAHGLKVCFFCEYLCFFLLLLQNNADHSYIHQYIFCQCHPSPHRVLA